jgi:hypothetical protein
MKSILKKKGKKLKTLLATAQLKKHWKAKRNVLFFFIFFGGSHTACCHTAQEKKMKACRLPGLQSQCFCSSPHQKFAQISFIFHSRGRFWGGYPPANADADVCVWFGWNRKRISQSKQISGCEATSSRMYYLVKVATWRLTTLST